MGSRRTPKKGAGRNDTANLPEEISEAITEIGGLERLHCKIPGPETIASEAAFHLALASKTRLALLWAIGCCDMCPCVLKEFLKIPDSKLSYHLSLLDQTGLVSSYRKKNWKIYTITDLGKSTLDLWSMARNQESKSAETLRGDRVRFRDCNGESALSSSCRSVPESTGEHSAFVAPLALGGSAGGTVWLRK